jgi:hypothetical protein
MTIFPIDFFGAFHYDAASKKTAAAPGARAKAGFPEPEIFS